MPLIFGTNIAETLTASTHEDTLHGHDGDDSLNASGVGYDPFGFMPMELHGGGGHDTLNGSVNNDYLFGNTGNDLLFGNDGRDTFFMGVELSDGGAHSGNDTAYGGAGRDTFIVGDGFDVVHGGDGDDRIEIDLSAETPGGRFVFNLWRDSSIAHANGSISFTSIEGIEVNGSGHLSGVTLLGRPGARDELTVTSDVDTRMYGFGGDDILYSWGGNDTLMGGHGDDAMNGRDGNDYMDGGDGTDLMFGGSGDDLLVGGDGTDILYGGDGRDVMYGGDRNAADGDADTFRFFSGNLGTGADRDVIRDFETGIDRVDLSGYTGTFTFIGATHFTGAGMEVQARELGSGNTLIRIDTDGDRIPDGELLLCCAQGVSDDDFIL